LRARLKTHCRTIAGTFTGHFAQKCSQILLVLAAFFGQKHQQICTALAQQAVFRRALEANPYLAEKDAKEKYGDFSSADPFPDIPESLLN